MKSFFTSDKTMKALPVVSVFMFAGVVCLSLIYGIYSDFSVKILVSALLIPVMFVLTVSFSRHEKNVQKTALGAITAILLARILLYGVEWFPCFPEAIAGDYYEFTLAPYITTISTALQIVGFLIIFINNLLLTGDHGSRPRTVKANRITVWGMFYLLLAGVVYDIAYMMTFQGTLLQVLAYICFDFLEVCAVTLVICVESRLDMFKAQREQE